MEPMNSLQEQVISVRRASQPSVSVDQYGGLPVLEGRHVTLRALRPTDARSLFAFMTTPEVSRFITEPPATVEGFERFILQTGRPRSGRHVCFAITLKGSDTAIGMFQIRELEPGFRTAEWGFALGSPFWGTGIFQEAASLVLEFAFQKLGVHRMEGRVAVRNGRGGRALQKIGAVQEGILRRSFFRDGQYLDQVLYTIVEDDWRASRDVSLHAAHAMVLH